MNNIDGKNLIDLVANSINNTSNFGIDIREIENLDKEEKIKRIAIQFEQILLENLLKEAFKEEDDEESSNLFGGSFNTLKDFKTMMLSQYFSERGGLGYQDVIERQIKEKLLNETNSPNMKKIKESMNFIRDNELELPVPPSKITSPFGYRIDPIDGEKRFHAGIDLRAKVGTPVKSIMSGEVAFSGWKRGYGNLVVIRHDNGIETKYAHNSKLMVKEGDRVRTGDIIALSGSSGRSTGPHLHFEVIRDGKVINPIKFFKEKNFQLYKRIAEINNVSV